MLNSAEHEFILLINVEIVGILTFICMIQVNINLRDFKQETHLFVDILAFYEHLIIRAQLS